ncbi:MAG: hypothetical protein WD826_05175 [Actinomycetota bacterium]
MKNLRSVAIAALLVIVAMGCGSTNEKADVAADASGAAGEAATSESKDAAAVEDEAASTGSGSSSATVSSGGASGVVPGSTGGKSASGLPLGTGNIKIGFHYSENLDTAYRALGASGSFVNMVGAIESMVKYVNANGGLGGKKVVPIMHGTDPLNGTFPAQAEAACTKFAQDEKVFATVQGAVLPDINSAACHAKYSSPLVWSYQYILDRKSQDLYEDYLYTPQGIAVDRYDFYIDELWKAKFLTKSSKVGLFRYDDPIHKLFLDTVVKPGLKKYGLGVIDKPLRRPQSAGEAGEVGAQAANAIIDFNSKGVDRVLFIPSGGAIPFIVGPVAENQNYFPRYAFTSYDIPTFLTDNLSDTQLEGAVTLGWMPTNDTYLPQAGKSAALERCFKAAGVRSATVVRFCDGLFFLKDSLDRTPLFDVSGLKKAAYALGSSFASPWSMGVKLRPGRHDGATSFKLMRFTASCSCFMYTGSAKPIP